MGAPGACFPLSTSSSSPCSLLFCDCQSRQSLHMCINMASCVQMRATKSGKQMCVHAKTATYLCTCERSSCFAKGLCEPWLVVPHLCIVSASSWPPEPVFFGPLIGASQPCSPPKLYIPILVNSSVLKRCIREMILASSLLLFQTM